MTAALAALLGPTACSSPAEPADPPATGTEPSVEFTASVTVDGSRLRVEYRLENRSGEELIVLNRVPSYSAAGTPQQDANAVYVTGVAGTGRVQVSKRAFAMPDTGMTWVQAPQVGGVAVPSGHSVQESLTVGLPLQRRHPYGDDVGEGVIKLPDPVTEVVFCVGVVRAADVQPPVAGEITLPHLAAVAEVQHLFCSPATSR